MINPGSRTFNHRFFMWKNPFIDTLSPQGDEWVMWDSPSANQEYPPTKTPQCTSSTLTPKMLQGFFYYSK